MVSRLEWETIFWGWGEYSFLRFTLLLNLLQALAESSGPSRFSHRLCSTNKSECSGANLKTNLFILFFFPQKFHGPGPTS